MFSFFKRKDKQIDTPLGNGVVIDGVVEISWSYRGNQVEVRWPEERPAPLEQFNAIQADFDRLVDLALKHLGVSEFPPELRNLVPETIDFTNKDADWSLDFNCAKWPDAWWGVLFKDGKIVGEYHGD